MPPTAALQRHAATSLRHLHPSGTLLPFLYCTSTIRQKHTVTADINQDADAPRSRNAAKGRHKRTKIAELRNGHLDGSGHRESNDRLDSEVSHSQTGSGLESASSLEWEEHRPASNSIRGHFDARHKRRQIQARRKGQDTGKDHYVAFEGIEDEAVEDQVKKDILEGTTVTSKERKAFEKLLQLGYGARQARAKATGDDGQAEKKTVAQRGGAGPKHDVRRGYEESQRREMPATLQPLIDKHWARSTTEYSEDASPLQQAIRSDIGRVRSLMAAAKSDVELWRILHDEAIARVLALGLDNDPSGELLDQQRDRTEGAIPDRDILMQSLQLHFKNFHHYSGKHFAASPLPPSLLPRLKALGPTSFAFAASTYVYNKHLSAMYRKDLDLSAFVATLEEMEHEVYEFDDKTYDVLRQVLGRANFVKQGRAGEGATALWGSERIKSNIGKIYLWSKKIRERLQEKALEEARAKEVEEMDRETGELDEQEAVAA